VCVLSQRDSTTVFDEEEVDQPPEVIVRSTGSNYPAEMRRRGIPGFVSALYVIDTLGRVIPGSIQMDTVSRRDFVPPARDLLLRVRFKPGEINGRKVAVCVRQRINFVLE